MAGVKITDLDQLIGQPADDDVLIVVDTSDNVTKQITVADLITATEDATTAQVADQFKVATESTNASFYVTFVASTSGQDSAKVDTALSYNPATNILTAGQFTGSGAGLTNVNADSALNAANAVLATTAITALNALAADSATTATSSITALRATSADSATNATNAIVALRATTADSAANATNALFATTATSALTADSATNATNANNAIRALTAAGADSAAFATSALTAQTAQISIFSDSAGNATNALHALNADAALIADSAFNAANALLATLAIESLGDLDNIRDSANGVTATGDLTVDSDLIVRGVLFGDGSGLTGVTSTSVATAAEKVDAKAADSTGTHYLMLRTTQTGYDSVSTKANLTYDPVTGILASGGFSGDGSNISNVAAVSATNASNVVITTVADSSTYFPLLSSTSSGNDNVHVSVNMQVNPFRGRLKLNIFATDNWEMFESANELFFSYNGVKKVKFDSSGNVFMTGTLTQSASL